MITYIFESVLYVSEASLVKMIQVPQQRVKIIIKFHLIAHRGIKNYLLMSHGVLKIFNFLKNI